MKRKIKLSMALLAPLLMGCQYNGLNEEPITYISPEIEETSDLEPIEIYEINPTPWPDVTFWEGLNTTLEEMTAVNRGVIAVSFLCLTTGTEISIDGDDLFFGASLAKLPRLMRIAEMVAEGELSWEQEIELRWENIAFAGGTGILQGGIREGDTRTIDELVRLTAVYSDNIAYWMLSSHTVSLENRIYDVFNHYFPNEETDGTNHFSANQMTRLLQILYNGLADIEGYERIFDYYLNSTFEERLKTPQTRGKVAQVIGSNGPYYHGVGIFIGEWPYVLSVMTHGRYFYVEYIGEISDKVWEIMQTLN